MEVSCTGCGKKYRIDEGKLPASGKAVMKCPGCGSRIELKVPDVKESQTAEASQGYPPGSEQAPPDPVQSREEPAGDYSTDSQAEADDEAGFEFFEPGTKTALVFCPDYEAMTQIEKALQQEEYQVRSISSAGEVQARYRYHIYDLLVIYQSGPEPEDRLRRILQWINNVNMEIRRRVLVLHISMNGNRYDAMQAFSMGVDATLSPLDIAVLPEVLAKVGEARETRYRIFNECLARVKEEVF